MYYFPIAVYQINPQMSTSKQQVRMSPQMLARDQAQLSQLPLATLSHKARVSALTGAALTVFSWGGAASGRTHVAAGRSWGFAGHWSVSSVTLPPGFLSRYVDSLTISFSQRKGSQSKSVKMEAAVFL